MDMPNASPKCALRGLVVLLAFAIVVGGAAREAVADVATCRSLQVYDPVTGAYDPAALLEEVTVEGVVYVAPGTYSPNGGGYLQDETGGINFWRWPAPLSIHVGDRLRITAPVWPDAGMLYLGDFTWTKLDSLLAPQPTTYTVAALLGDFSNTGSHVSVTGRIADLTADSFRLEDGPDRIEVRRSAFAGVDFSGLVAGRTCTVTSPCLIEEGTLYLMPASQAAIAVHGKHHVATTGDDAGLGTEERPYRTIQRGIDAAANGDVVLIADGTYTGAGNRDISFQGKVIRVRSGSGNREACVVDAQGSEAEPHVGFRFTGGETRETVLEGLTVTGGYPAGLACGVSGPFQSSEPTIRAVSIEQNPGVGLSVVSTGAGRSSARIVSSLIRNNASGGAHLAGFDGVSIDSCVVNGNTGIGISLSRTDGNALIADTEVSDNTADGIYWSNAGFSGDLLASRCRIGGNGGWGAIGEHEDAYLQFYDSVIEDNALGGVRMLPWSTILAIHGTDVRNNGGPGIDADVTVVRLTIANSRIIGNAGDGIMFREWDRTGTPLNPGKRTPAIDEGITDCVISDNGGEGIDIAIERAFTIARTAVTRNRSGGIFLRGTEYARFSLSNLTISDNIGIGVNCTMPMRLCLITNTVIASSTGPAMVAASTESLAIFCSDFHGNQGGNWTGSIAGYLSTNGNLSVDPLFCDPTSGDYQLRQDSPLSAVNSGSCGTIGAFEWACAALSHPDHYVATTGDDAGPGTKEQPYRTIQRGIAAADSGDVVLIADGLYTGQGNRDIDFMGKVIRVRSSSGNREACVVDAQGSVDQPHVGFRFSGGETPETVLEGLTVTGGYPAGITCRAPTSLLVCSPTLRSVLLRDNPGWGMTVVGYSGQWDAMSSPRLVSASVRANVGGGVQMTTFNNAVIDSCDVTDNGGVGLQFLAARGLIEVRDSNIERNIGSGISARSDGTSALLSILRSRAGDNGGWGIFHDGEDARLRVDHSVIAGNGLGGIRCTYRGQFVEFNDSDVINNFGPGIRIWMSVVVFTVSHCHIIGNAGDGITTGIDNANAAASLEQAKYPDWPNWMIADSIIRENDGIGIYMHAHYGVAVDKTLLARNSNGGVVLFGSSSAQFRLASLTIVDNGGVGVSCGYSSGRIFQLSSTVIANNAGPAVADISAAVLELTCSDIHGNTGGDWVGPAAGFAGLHGNLNVEPRFCDGPRGDYHLREDSLLAAGNNPSCGTVGALGVECSMAPFEPRLRDVPADQGGQLRVSWLRSPSDDPGAATPITSYEVQRLGGAWQPIATLAAAAADSYATVVATPDILTAGQAAPWARYRLVARTADPGVFFESVVDSGYSVDNLAPPRPEAVLVEGLDYRYVTWTDPGIADLGTACVYRGEVAGFTPGEPVACPEDLYAETHLRWYFYRVRFTDTHGNVSEFSDELHGQWPTGVPGAEVAALRLYPCRPNPFNPRTTIRFDLPEAGAVRLAVYDLGGRMVRVLVDEALGRGVHEVEWDGRDEAGKEVGSGVYLGRLEVGGAVRAVRMGLVR